MINKIAKQISAIFQPVLIPSYGALLLAFFDPWLSPYLPINYKLLIVGVVVVFSGVLPAAVVLSMLWSGRLSDAFISDRTQRTIPYILSMLSYFVGTYMLWNMNMPLYWIAIMLGTCICLQIIMLINFKWKISAHSAAMGGVCGAIIVLGFMFHVNNVLAICMSLVVSGLVCSSRVYLKAHTLAQTLAGWTLGAVGVGFAIYLSY